MTLMPRLQGRQRTMLARTALAHYALPPARLRLRGDLFNTTFQVVTPEGARYLLRLHMPGQTSPEVVRSEMLWLAALRQETDLRVPEPLPNRADDFVTQVTRPESPTRLCTLLRWLEGRFLYRGLAPAHLAQVGRLMAQLHHHALSWQPPAGFVRRRVDNLFVLERDADDGFREGIAERAVEFVAAVGMAAEADLLAEAIRRVWGILRALGGSPEVFGLIHGDLHQRNLLFRQGRVSAIDFDDCGYGHFLYDFAVPLTELEGHPDYAALRLALLEGYRQLRPLPEEQEACLDTFLALRRIQNVLGILQERERPAFQDGWEGLLRPQLQELKEYIRLPSPTGRAGPG